MARFRRNCFSACVDRTPRVDTVRCFRLTFVWNGSVPAPVGKETPPKLRSHMTLNLLSVVICGASTFILQGHCYREQRCDELYIKCVPPRLPGPSPRPGVPDCGLAAGVGALVTMIRFPGSTCENLRSQPTVPPDPRPSSMTGGRPRSRGMPG